MNQRKSRGGILTPFGRLPCARTRGFDRKTGSLTPGKDADIVLINTESLRMFQINNPIGAVGADARGGNVDAAFVRGRAVKRDGKLVVVKATRRRMEASCDGRFPPRE